MDDFEKIGGFYQNNTANGSHGTETGFGKMYGQPWRIGKVTSVSPYKVDIAGIVYEGDQLYINWIFQLRDWECEKIHLPNHPYVSFTETDGSIKLKQEALLSVGDTVVVLLVDDQTAYLMAKVVPA